jgi:hypothetical protein
LDFDFFDYVWYWDKPHLDILKETPKIERWLRVSHRVGSDMCYWVLNKNGNVLSQTMVQHVTQDNAKTNEMKTRLEEFDKKLNTRQKILILWLKMLRQVSFGQSDVGYADDGNESGRKFK